MTIFVLVHGAWHGGWCWSRVVRELRAQGQEAFAPTLTGLGERTHLLHREIDLDLHIQDICGVLQYEGLQSVTLVGHSYGGMVITAVASQLPHRVRQLVYVDAFVPDDDQCLFDLVPVARREALRERAQAWGEGWKVPPPPVDRLGITTGPDRQWVEAKLAAQPLRTFEQPVKVDPEQLQGLPRAYLYCLNGMVDVFGRFADVARASRGWRYWELKAGHDVMIVDPEALATILMKFV